LRLEQHILVATGGDDNALGISAYPISGSTPATIPTFFILRSAHAAAVTGLSFLHDPKTKIGEEGKIQIVSSGNDQKVIAWNVNLDNHHGEPCIVQLKKTGEAFTPVADVGDVVAFGLDSRVLVVGNGTEVWKIADLESRTSALR
jgi:hypothetical protein